MREEYFDFWRGIAIVFVVAIHTFGGYLKVFDAEATINLNIIVRNIIQVAVPIFLAISGYFLAQKDLSTISKYKTFEIRQIAKIYLPCLIWSLPYFFESAGRGSLGSRLTDLFTGGFSVYYFIALIIQLYLLLPLLQKTSRYGSLFILVTFIITWTTTMALYFLEFRYNANLSLWDYAAPFVGSIAYFSLGVLYGRGGRVNISIKVLFLLLIALMIFRYWESSYLWIQHHSGAAFGMKCLSTPLYNMVFLMLMFSLKQYYKPNIASGMLVKLGDYSFGIYLIHLLILEFVVDATYPHLNWLIKVPLVIAGSCVVIWCGRKLLPSVVRRYLGF